ncbi:AlkZ family DNA glycosylase [Herbiconiux sp. VKM Ac-1786]|uniref:winged helix DNA-binding domain-containing protein n=1 Tax=Herbiconiux sp. VKM Ac-1786 TaxID=2783824 RepID=UPI00188B2406|nr:winged helix DNA-binding domain-containing protein [Herbiconiux sp. VKM Ac-1786]MBF4571535.1 AlkZ family DNA glycosylase [Herbiconiux sp. VKM Ac-1786]
MSRRIPAGERELLQRRLASQWLTPAGGEQSGGDQSGGERDRAARVAAVTRRMLATQAQDFGQGVWALGVRAPGSTRRDVTTALDDGSVVRSWPMRGTLHFIDPDDLRGFLSLTARRTVTGAAARHRGLGIDEQTVARARDVATGLLRGGGRASREQFTAALESAGLEPTGQRGMHLIWLLAHEGLICWGPMAEGGTQQALVLLDEWAPATRDRSPDEAHDELLLRYVRGHGPTTLKDFCHWSKLLVSDSSAALARIRDRLEEVELGGASYLVEAGDIEARAREAGTAPPQLALPGFDEFLLGYRSRQPALAAEFSARVVPGENGMFFPMLVSRGAIVGTWKRSITAKAVTVTTDPFEPLTAAEQKGFERALRRYAAFLELPLTGRGGR